MSAQNAHDIEHLESAFQTFNQVSEALVSSYHLLECQIEKLNSEIAAVRDERLQQLNETKKLANRLEHFINALPGGVVVLGETGVISEVNPAAVELLGQPLKGVLWRNVIQRAFSPQFDDGHEVSLRDGRRVSIDTSSLGDEPGQIILIKDVTETRQLQEKLSRYHRLSSMGKIAASLAHQIRTPTSAAMLYLSALRHHKKNPDEIEKYSDKIRDQLRHIESMVSDILIYVKGGDKTQHNIFEVESLVKKLSEVVQTQSKICQLTILNHLPGQKIRGNQDALLGALINLVINSMNAIKSVNNPFVEVVFSQCGSNAMKITVSDNGCGIPDKIKNSIFEPFITTRPQGTGLGLAIVKSVIDKFGGEITFNTQPGSGTEFRIILPNLLNKDEISEQNLQKEVCK